MKKYKLTKHDRPMDKLGSIPAKNLYGGMALGGILNGIRTKETIGVASKPPTVGESFVMAGDPMTEGANVRYIQTSRVVEVLEDRFITESGSTYLIEELGEVEDGSS